LLSLAALDPVRPPRRAGAGDIASQPRDRQLSYRDALRDALAEEMRRDASVFLIGVDVVQNRGAPKVAHGLADEFGPRRVVSVPPLDEALLGMAVGAALAGLKPVVEIASWGRAFEALSLYLATAAETFYLSGGSLRVPIVLRGPNGFAPGLTGRDARCVASELAQIPGLKVVQPATALNAKALLKAAIRDPGPVAVLEHELLYGTSEAVEGDGAAIAPLGRARLARRGADISIAAAGHAVSIVLAAADRLAREGIDAEVIDLMSLRPLDRETVAASVKRTGRLMTVEEGPGDGGIGAELIASVVTRAFSSLRAAPVRVAGAPVPMPYAAELQALATPRIDDVVRAATELVKGR
jgi:pyruvate dehydrogenase E1 component beta subunit